MIIGKPHPSEAPSSSHTPRICDHADCNVPGEYKAPKSRHHATDHWWFCLEHVRQYNAQWNYFAGMEEQEIYAQMQDALTGNRPTWPTSQPYRLYTHHEQLQDAVHRMQRGEDSAATPGAHAHAHTPEHRRAPRHVRTALATLELQLPISLPELKKAYKALVKRTHPDVNRQDTAATENFKRITSAYDTVRHYLRGN